MENKVVDLLNLKCRVDRFKVVVWGNDNKIKEQFEELDNCDILYDPTYEKIKRAILLNWDVETCFDNASNHFIRSQLDLRIISKVVLNVRYEEEE